MQVVKCDNNTCCTPLRSNLRQVLIDGFLPAPFKNKETSRGIKACDFDEDCGRFAKLTERSFLANIKPDWQYGFVPFDAFCPSVHDEILQRTCLQCKRYFVTKGERQKHNKLHQTRQLILDDADDIVQLDEDVGAQDDAETLPVITDIREFLVGAGTYNADEISDKELEF